MRLLSLAREYWEQVAEPELRVAFPGLFPRIAAGLVGNGSECFGYDDRLSQDHDWGVDFYLWVGEDDRAYIPELTRWKENLLSRRPPKFTRLPSPYGTPPTVMTVKDFYRQLIGCPGVPSNLLQWRCAPEEHFAIATNGDVFWDGSGEFSSVRSGLLSYYPEDIRKKKIAARCMALAQTGQYNFQRTAQRRDWVTVRLILSRFMQEAMGLLYHLNRVYRPYYKWQWRGLTELPILGLPIANLLLELSQTGGLNAEARRRQQAVIDRICALLTAELHRQGLSSSPDEFLAVHGLVIQGAIWDRTLRRIPPQDE